MAHVPLYGSLAGLGELFCKRGLLTPGSARNALAFVSKWAPDRQARVTTYFPAIIMW